MNPGDVIIIGKKVWKCTGNYLGATGHQSIVGLESITLKPGGTGTQTVKTLFVPLEFIDKLNESDEPVIYKR